MSVANDSSVDRVIRPTKADMSVATNRSNNAAVQKPTQKRAGRKNSDSHPWSLKNKDIILSSTVTYGRCPVPNRVVYPDMGTGGGSLPTADFETQKFHT